MSGSNAEFVYEASTQIEKLSDGLIELQRDGFDRATLDDLFRQAHTLKGNCSAEGFTEPSNTAHALEDLLDGVRRTPDRFEPAYVDAALDALDVLEQQLTELQAEGVVTTDAAPAVKAIRELVPEAQQTDAGESERDDAIDIDDIEMPTPGEDDDVSVEEALENASVFDDLEGLEGTVDTDGFDDIEGVGLFHAEESTDNSVTSSTRRDSSVPGDESYAQLAADTDIADPETLQSELDDVTFGEFDDDDELSIGELVDIAEETGSDSGQRASSPDGTAPAETGVETETATADGTAFQDGPAEDVEFEFGTASDETNRPMASFESDTTADTASEPDLIESDMIADTDDHAPPSETSVTSIVDQIEQLGASEEKVDGADSSTAGSADDEIGAAFEPDAQSQDDSGVLPSDVPDVETLLEETESDDLEAVEFASAELYDRVGFETDRSTGAFVSEFAEAFDGDSTRFDAGERSIRFDAGTTIPPSVLGEEPTTPDVGTRSSETVREVTLDVEEADSLLELTEELVVNTQRLTSAVEDLPPEAADALNSLRDVSGRIENHVTSVRLVPLEAALSGLARTTRRVARAQDKQVTFLTENESIEVDRRIVDELADPLVHLVRNAVDHGIEPPTERTANGKPAEGTVLVRAERTGETVTIAIEDDGRGIDPDDLRAEAVEEGLYSRSEARALSRDEALKLMFHAGLSTTDEVTDVSGRGVGMDVVSDTITRLEGTIDVQSEPGIGTTIKLTLPVSVALSDVVLVMVGGQRFGFPAADVRRVEELLPERIDGDEYQLLTGADEFDLVPLIDLESELRLDDAPRSVAARSDILILTDEPEPRVIRCHDVIDWQSVVLQPFDGVLRDLDTTRGAAFVDSGEPIVVLETAELGGGR